MISYRSRGGKRGRSVKLTKNLDRLYKESKCREFSVVVTRMDFAKILGKFTKVKIQYESSSSPKTQKTPANNKTEPTTPSNTRLRNNENGMVQFHRKAYNPHPAKSLITTRRNAAYNNKAASPTQQTSTNVLKENNILKNTNLLKTKSVKHNSIVSNGKQYAIIFNNPTINHNNSNFDSEFSLLDLLPKLNKHILPSEEWCIEYFPKNNELKNDKVYDRIAAELEDLMYNEKREDKLIKTEAPENKVDEFPSIMDILNDNATPETTSENKDQNSSLELKDNLESHDVEAMLLGKTTSNSKLETPMDIDNSEVNKLIADVAQFSSNTEPATNDLEIKSEIGNPHSPSILDEALQKGIEEHLPNPHLHSNANQNGIQNDVNVQSMLKFNEVIHVMFKKVINGKCIKSVTCPRNLKYSIELEDKSVEFLGAPKYIANLDDLQVLLQIVNETDLTSLYILY